MDGSKKRRLVVGAAAAVLVAGGGGAIAARQLSSSSESQAVLNDAAKQLGVSPTALSNALKQAYANRIDAAVAAGRLSKTEGDALKARLGSGPLMLPPFFGGRHADHDFGFRAGLRGDLSAAASYLGLTQEKLETQLEAGKTLAKIATDNGKTAAGLIQALVDSRTKELEAAVKAGRLTKADEQMLLSGLEQHITELVNGTGRPHFFEHDGPPGGRPFGPPGGRPFFHPPEL